MSPTDSRLPHEKGSHVSWDQIHRDSRALAWRLDHQGPGEGGADVNQAETSMGAAGRVLVRASGTEPVLRVMVEGEDADLVAQLARELADVVATEAEEFA